jgi:hypothetical protein
MLSITTGCERVEIFNGDQRSKKDPVWPWISLFSGLLTVTLYFLVFTTSYYFITLSLKYKERGKNSPKVSAEVGLSKSPTFYKNSF